MRVRTERSFEGLRENRTLTPTPLPGGEGLLIPYSPAFSHPNARALR
jgi:hypothetical protein